MNDVDESRDDTGEKYQEYHHQVPREYEHLEESDQEYSEFRLVTTGILANSPWKIFVGFKTVIAAAFATGAYALIFPTIWLLGDSFGLPRLIGLMVAAIAGLIFWMVIAHSLWEKPSDEAELNPLVTPAMQNIVTLLTLALATVISYAVLFLLLFFSAWIFVSNEVLSAELGHAVTLKDYATMAWVAASISTITGALGSGLEDDDAVRNAVNYR